MRKILMILLLVTIGVPSYPSQSDMTSEPTYQSGGKDRRKKAAKAAKKQRKHIAKYGERKHCKNAKGFRF